MARLSASLRAAIREAVDIWEFDLPDGTTWRLGPEGEAQASASQGWYEPRIRGWVPWSESLGDSADNAIQQPAFTLSVTDIPGKAHSIRDMLGRGDRIQNIPARRYLAAPLPVAQADWCQKWTGVLDDWSLESGTVGSLRVRPDDSAMLSPILKRKASLYDWPNLPQENEGKLLGFIVGKHSDEGKNCAGAITLWQIDNVDYKYYVSQGRVNVLRVRRAGAIQTLTTNYTVEYPLVNGIRYTLVNMVANPGSDEITVDVEGHYTVGTGTGQPIMASCAVDRHILSNFIFGDDTTREPWKDGAWLAESSRIHAASWNAVATKLAGRAGGAAYVGAVHIDDARTGYAWLNQRLKADHRYAYWRGDGTLALFMWDSSAAASPLATLTETQAQGFKVTTSRDRMLKSVVGQFGPDSRYELEVTNPLALTDQTEVVDCSTGPNTWP